MRRGGVILGVVLAVGVIVGAAGAGGCGAEEARTTSTASEAGSGATDNTLAVGKTFTGIATLASPMPVYGCDELPLGVTVAGEWWPVVESATPAGYQEQALANPHVKCGDGGQVEEAEVLLRAGEGWLVVLENFRGDLGEVTGRAVGSVGGHQATFYQVNGGSLVQWSDQGRWYGVFGRGVPAELVITLALSMRAFEAEGGL